MTREYLLIESNTCTYDYILPLLGRRESEYRAWLRPMASTPILTYSEYNKLEGDIGDKILFDALLTYENDEYYLSVIHNKEHVNNILQTHAQYKSSENIGSIYIINYNIPKLFHEDIDKMLNGKFSEFSGFLKKRLESHYTKWIIKDKLKNRHYCVLNKDQGYRKSLENYLNCNIKETAELRSIPNIDNEILNRQILHTHESSKLYKIY